MERRDLDCIDYDAIHHSIAMLFPPSVSSLTVEGDVKFQCLFKLPTYDAAILQNTAL